jgi:hypothetical protein
MNIAVFWNMTSCTLGVQKKKCTPTAAFYALSPKLRTATISVVISVFPFVRQFVRIEHLGSHWTDFHES